MSEAEKEAIGIMKHQLHHISGVPELYIHVFHKGDANVEMARKCALSTVDEMIDRLIWHTEAGDLGNTVLVDDIKYWQQVKAEIEKL